MAFRTGDGQRIEDIQAAIADWRAEGRSPSTYCGRMEWEAWQDDLGELIIAKADGTELRRHANIKTRTRGDSYKIAHNRVLVGNPAQYKAWDEDPNKTGAMIKWTYYPDSVCDRLLAEHTESMNA